MAPSNETKRGDFLERGQRGGKREVQMGRGKGRGKGGGGEVKVEGER